MKNITILFILLLTCTIGFGQKEKEQIKMASSLGESNPVYYIEQEQLVENMLDPCVEDNPSNAFENAFTTSSDQAQIMGTDITVAADENFSLETITVNLWVNTGETIASADITLYNDAGGVPDSPSIVDAQVAVVPTSQSLIGTSLGFDVIETIFDITPTMLAGQAGVSTSYWVSLYVATSTGSAFLEASTASVVGYDHAFSTDGGVSWNANVGWESVYNFAGDCTSILATSDNDIEGFSYYPNPANNVINLSAQDNIERVAVYNILGQKVIDQNINATSSQLDVTNLTTGTYLMEVSVDGKTATYKIVKE